jgi:hypothetical protein
MGGAKEEAGGEPRPQEFAANVVASTKCLLLGMAAWMRPGRRPFV